MVIKPSACHSSSFELRVSLIRNPSSETARLNYQLLPILECLAGALPFLIESAGRHARCQHFQKKLLCFHFFSRRLHTMCYIAWTDWNSHHCGVLYLTRLLGGP